MQDNLQQFVENDPYIGKSETGLQPFQLYVYIMWFFSLRILINDLTLV